MQSYLEYTHKHGRIVVEGIKHFFRTRHYKIGGEVTFEAQFNNELHYMDAWHKAVENFWIQIKALPPEWLNDSWPI